MQTFHGESLGNVMVVNKYSMLDTIHTKDGVGKKTKESIVAL